MIISFTPEVIAGICGLALSWFWAWFPGARTWYAALKPALKSGIMLGLLALFSVGIYLLAFYGVIATTEPVTVMRLVIVFFISTTINQTTYRVTPEAKDVIAIKNVRTAALVSIAPKAAVSEVVKEIKSENA